MKSMKMRTLLIALIFIFIAVSLFFAIKGETKEAASNHDGLRSSELEAIVTTEGDTERTDYYNNGALTYAADRHYATCIKTRNGNTVLEQFFDASGAPAIQPAGHYALLREYDDQNRIYKTTYLGQDGQPILNTSGFCFWIRSFNEEGLVEYERYYGTDGEPVVRISGDCGRYNEYENSRNTVIIYLDDKDKATMITSGYAILHRTFIEEGENTGRVDNDFYFDEHDQPIALSLGQYGVHYEYDELGRVEVITYLGPDGSPMATNQGYTSIKRTFFPDDTVETQMYYDLNGSPVALFAGQYGVKTVNGKQVYLDQNGKEVFNLRKWLNDTPIAVIIAGIITVFCSLLFSKKGNVILLILYLVFIIYMTLMNRPDAGSRAELTLFWSYKDFLSVPSTRLQILNNIWLFIPLGTILYKLVSRWWILLFPVALSFLIELIQYFTGLGLAEIDDLVSNTLGALIGFGLGAAGSQFFCHTSEEECI